MNTIAKGVHRSPGRLEATIRGMSATMSRARLYLLVAFLRRVAVALNPRSTHFHAKLGNALRDLKRLDEALASYDRALALKPDHAEALYNRGTVLRGLKRSGEALASYDHVLALKPDFAEAFNNRGNALRDLKRLDEALASYDRALALKPDHAGALYNRGNALQDLKRFDEALASYDRAIALRPDHAEAFNNRGNTLHELKRLDEALASFDQAIALRPGYADAFYNRGNALHKLKRLDEALASYDQAIARKRGYANAVNNRGIARLLDGRFREGWADYEWRWRATEIPGERPTIGARTWQGENLAGARIAIYAEQGLGDVIQFARYLPLLVQRGAKVTFLAPAELVRLLRPLSPEIEVVSSIEARGPFDFQCALMSLPFQFGTELSSIPNQVPYLSAEKDLIARWANRLGGHGFKIGIAWQGNPNRMIDRGRSIPLAEFVPLLRLPGLRAISLQKNHGLDQLASLPAGVNLEILGDEFDRGPDAFLDTAAVMANLDLIVTSDTSIAHLAGALGRPTWVALKYVPDWRWLLDREHCPWYPTMRLFRQQTDGDWKSVFSKIEQLLRSQLAYPPSLKTTGADDYAEAHYNRGTMLQGLKRLDEALASYDRALALKPDHAGALYSRGTVLRGLKRSGEALASYDRVLALKPDFAEAFNNRGNALRDLKRLDEALVSYDRALALKPDHAGALYNRGNALQDLKRFDEALASYDQAIALRPGHAEAFNNRGNALKELKRLDEALASYDQAIALKPGYADAFNSRGNTLKELWRLDDALASYDQAIALNPGHAEAFNNRGCALHELKRLEEALGSYDRAIALRPGYAEAINNRGSALHELKRLGEALASFEQAIALKPGFANAFLNRGIARLLDGRIREGYADYEWRWKATGIPRKPPAIDGRTWQGENLAGARIAIYAEQGLGDAIQFARYLPLLVQRGAKVTFLAPAKLVRLLQPLSPEIEVVSSIEARGPFDFQCALMSLPFRFGTELSSIPNQVPYLSAEKDRVAKWTKQLGGHGFKIGIAWQGNPNRMIDRGRSIPLAEFVPLLRLPGLRAISLQKNHGLDQLASLPAGVNLEILGDEFDRGPDAFLDSAAVMANLDLIVTSDTSIAHLAGALGRPTWVALKYVPDWRWLLDREDCPWYPTMHLFRQQTDGDWKSVFSKIEQQLRSQLAYPPSLKTTGADGRLRTPDRR
jgi:tetratricopeptide (TPR) repeat protein